jgi:SAM-dependent methyltransferase
MEGRLAYLRWRRFLELAALDRPWVARLLAPKHGAGPAPAEHWDGVYQAGAYDRLFNSDERHHHRLLAALVAGRIPKPSVLEIGAGEGAFYDTLAPFSPSRYLGIDLSEVAVERARARLGLHAHKPSGLFPRPVRRKVEFAVGDGAAYAPTETFDVIVFAECIEYLGQPEDFLAHYARFLAPGGIFGFTQWLNLRPIQIAHQIKALAPVLDEALISAPWGGAWQVWTCDPPGPR